MIWILVFYLLEKREIEKNDDCGFLLLQEEILLIFTEENWCATHIALVTSVDNDYIYTVDGNTNGDNENWANTSKVSINKNKIPNITIDKLLKILIMFFVFIFPESSLCCFSTY